MHALTSSDIVVNLLIFVMATFLGLELIRHVSRHLHTPLMSLTNAISSVSIIGALVVLAGSESRFSTILATVAVALAASNAIGGFMITERILALFRKRGRS